MTDLPPFSGDHPRCSKCAHRGAATEWRPYIRAVVSYGNVLEPAVNEHLRRSCLRCGYRWSEAIVSRR